MRAEDLPRANDLPCAQRPIKRANLKNMLVKRAGTYKKVPINICGGPARVVFLSAQT